MSNKIIFDPIKTAIPEMKKISFNRPFLTGKETEYIVEAVNSGKISGNGMFTKKCHTFFEKKYNFKKCLLTTSCTDALEMAALLLDIKPSDEVIIPSYTFVSTANAFVLRGAKILFADSSAENPNIDSAKIENLISSKTKAIVVVHYAGIACNMDVIMGIAKKHNLFVIEDAAHAIDSYYKDKVLGGIGHLATFSFHETKNIISGEGGMLVINDEQFIDRAEIIWEKGTNRAAFFRGEVDKYNWVDVGSSFLPSEIVAAFLYAQLEAMETIQTKRKALWNDYARLLEPLFESTELRGPQLPAYASNNAHMFYVLCKDIEQRTELITYLDSKNINSVFHYISLHKSPYYKQYHDGRTLSMTDNYTDRLLRLPLYYDLKKEEIAFICESITDFFHA